MPAGSLIMDGILALLDLVKTLKERARQEGLLTPEQEIILLRKEAAVYGEYENAPAPPPPAGA